MINHNASESRSRGIPDDRLIGNLIMTVEAGYIVDNSHDVFFKDHDNNYVVCNSDDNNQDVKLYRQPGEAVADFLGRDGFEVSEGGFVHRLMPPTSWHFGDIPTECHDPSLSPHDIMQILLPVYTSPENLARLVAGGHAINELVATLQAEIVAELDAGTIWGCNQAVNHEKGL